MSAAPITKSQVKLASWAESRRRDRLAREIMEREGISFSEARAKALISRMEKMDQIKAKISSSMKSYFSTHTVTMPPKTEETRKRMSEAAKKRGMSRATIEKARAANIARCAQMTPEQRRAMFSKALRPNGLDISRGSR